MAGLGAGVSLGVISKLERSFSASDSLDGSDFDSTLPRDVGGVEVDTIEVEAIELAGEVDKELASECGIEPMRPVPFETIPLLAPVIWDICKPLRFPGLLERLELLGVGLGNG